MTTRAQQRGSSSFIDTLAVIAMAFGVGVIGVRLLDAHAHTCDTCGHRWRHLGAFNIGDERAHTCARCGQTQWWKCGVPHAIRDAHAMFQPMHGQPGMQHVVPHGQEFYETQRPALPSRISAIGPHKPAVKASGDRRRNQ